MGGYRRTRWAVRGLLLAAAVLVLLPRSDGAERPERPQRSARPAAGRNRWAELLPVGSEAPDFRLPRLLVTKTDDGRWIGRVGAADEKAGKDEPVRLSSFRGKKPVCLIFSSYT